MRQSGRWKLTISCFRRWRCWNSTICFGGKKSELALFATLNTSFGVALCQFPFAQVAHEALSIAWTMDPFDRLIVAQAGANHGAMLITRDRLIRRNYSNAVW